MAPIISSPFIPVPVGSRDTNLFVNQSSEERFEQERRVQMTARGTAVEQQRSSTSDSSTFLQTGNFSPARFWYCVAPA